MNLFKLLAAALTRQAPRKVILTERGDFPTDLYVAQGVRDLIAGELRLAPVGALEAAHRATTSPS